MYESGGDCVWSWNSGWYVFNDGDKRSPIIKKKAGCEKPAFAILVNMIFWEECLRTINRKCRGDHWSPGGTMLRIRRNLMRIRKISLRGRAMHAPTLNLHILRFIWPSSRKDTLYFVYFHHGKSVLLHFEADIVSCKDQTVDPVGFSLIGGPGIVG